MKKIILIIILIIGIFVFFKKEENKEIRIRILANSNSLTDQLEKIVIKETIVKIIENDKIALNSIDKNIILINEKLKSNLDKELYNKLKIEFKTVNFPAKSVNGKIIKAGSYPTLLITISEGKGKNWWSILYPEFFGVEYDDNNEIEYKLYLKEILKINEKIVKKLDITCNKEKIIV